MHHGKYSGHHISNPRYELKQILILLRQVNDIPLSEMAKKLEITTTKLMEYERSLKQIDDYEAVYIEVLKEYIELAVKYNRTFEDALKIYINQRGLYKYNNTYKVVLFGHIMYDTVCANMDSLREKDAIVELPQKADSSKYHVWSVERYNTAFYVLGMLREMLGLNIKEAAIRTGVTVEMLKAMEDCTRSLKNTAGLYEQLKLYSDYLTRELMVRKINANALIVVTDIIHNGYTRSLDSLKLRQILLNEILK